MMHIKIVTPREVYMDKDIDSIHVKTVEGEITLLPNHTPIFAALVPCPMLIGHTSQIDEYALSGGFLKMENKNVLILTDAVEGKGEIDIERAQAAYKRAKERIEKKDADTNMRRANLALQRAITRINVYGK
ncbi:MAG: ATP synthase F1 subunit epsilon [Erysipelotrichaceae bacterium]|nr:ATP synthase F1 subunit epsilon [Erysipelotrichaceae bacterium]